MQDRFFDMSRRDYLVSAGCCGPCDKSLVSKFPVYVCVFFGKCIARINISDRGATPVVSARRGSHIRHIGETKTGDAN